METTTINGKKKTLSDSSSEPVKILLGVVAICLLHLKWKIIIPFSHEETEVEEG